MDTTSPRANSPADESRAFDLAERILDRLRSGDPADLSAECRYCPELIPQVRSLVEAAAELEGLSTRFAAGDAAPTGYQLVREIARGGMGVVYEARQLLLNRTVAFKMVLNADPSGLLRFLAEAEAIAAVRHPNVVQVYESGQHDGQPYLAMEFCPGGTLAAMLKGGGRMAPTAAVELMAQVAAGVAAAHAEGIVHRDLKPGNVLFDAAGIPKVADFGLAKRGAGADLTHTQAVMGTPAYMSPEQARGETKFVGPTADVWALGVILFECLTGTKPFDGDNPMAVLDLVRSGVVAGVRSSHRDVPRDIELIVQKCLAKEPAERYPTAAELAADLGNWLAGRPITAKPAGFVTRGIKWVKRNPSRATAILLATLLVIGLAVGWVVAQERVADVRVAAQVDRLRTAAASDVANLRADLTADRRRAGPLVRAMLAQAHAAQDTRGEFNAALVLVAWDGAHTAALLDRALVAPPDEVLAVRDALAPRMAEVRIQLRQIATDTERPRAERLRALALLAGDTDAPSPATAAEIAPQLLAEDRLQLPTWIRALDPVKSVILDPLTDEYARQPDADSGVAAALVLREFLRGQGRRVVPLIARGGPRQAYILGVAVKDDPDGVNGLLAEWWRFDPTVPDTGYTTNREEGGNAEATRRTKYGLALLAAGRGDAVWPALAASDEPQLRTDLIHAFAPAGVPPQMLEQTLALPDPAVRQAVYLAWGEYPPDRWGAAEFNRRATAVADDFATHPDPGVHSAADWLLRKWKQHDRLSAARKTLPGERVRGDRRWYVTPTGTTFAVVPGPVTTRLGGFYEWAHASSPVAGPELPHRRRIGRTYALATTEVTVAQFKRFYEAQRTLLKTDFTFQGWANRDDDCPVGTLDWYTAARFCRWLGEQEGLTEAEQCYQTLDKIGPGMSLPPDFLDRPGYRLPTEAEWEYACRGPSRTLFGFGSDRESLSQYAWWMRNAGDQTHPVGLLKPNGLGLFDIHGNAFEWCGHRALTYPAVGQFIPVLEDSSDGDECRPEDQTTLRGGDFPANEDRLRTAHRTVVPRRFSWPASGLRLCRTLAVPRLDVYRAEGEETRSTYAVRGPAGKYRVRVVTGDVTVSAAEGDIPGRFEVVANGGRGGAFGVVVERMGTGEKHTINGEFTPAEWTVNWLAWKPNPVNSLAEVLGKDWDEAVKAPPLRTATATRPIALWGDKPPTAGVPENFNGFVATAAVPVTGGRYRLSGVNTVGGYRVTVDRKVVLSYRWPGRVNRETVVLDLPAGKHEFQVEAYHVVGKEMFDLELVPES